MLGAWLLVGFAVETVFLRALVPNFRKFGTALRIFFLIVLSLAACSLLLLWAAHNGKLNLERDFHVFWLSLLVVCGCSSFVLGSIYARFISLEIATAVAWMWQLAICLTVFFAPDAGLASPIWRLLIVAPVALLLGGVFGASVGFLLRGDRSWTYEWVVGRRFLLADVSAVLSTVTSISVIGVTLGVWMVLLSLGILGGFESDLRDKIIGVNAHVLAESSAGVQTYSEAQKTSLAAIPEVHAVTPYVQGEVAIASRNNYVGAVLFGIDPVSAPSVIRVFSQLAPPSALDDLSPKGADVQQQAPDLHTTFKAPRLSPSIIVGIEMARALSVSVGDTVRVISPTQEVLTPLGVAPRSLAFRVVGIFESKMYEFDARYAYVNLPNSERFFGLVPGSITGFQLRLNDDDRTENVVDEAARILGNGWRVQDWKGRNETLFSALKLERVVAFIVLAFIILVASFSIVNTLTMSVIEKHKEIAILKTMGAKDEGIMRIFLVQGMLIGAFGTFCGTFLALASVYALKHFGLGIPGEVYYIDSLPVDIGPGDVTLVVLAALLIVWDFAVFPALRGAQLRPVEGMRGAI